MAQETPSAAAAQASADLNERVVATALAAARRAGEIQMQAFRKATPACTKLLHDVKIATDRRCEEAIVETVRNSFPDHAILTEESGALPVTVPAGGSSTPWTVRSTSGTGCRFSAFRLPAIATPPAPTITGSTEAGLPGRPLAGVVFLPYSDEMFLGVSGRGAFLNQRPIHVCRFEGTRNAVVAVSFGKTPALMDCMTQRLAAILPQVRKARCLGAAAAELAYAAAGFLGGVVYEGIKQWDFAAGKILLEEAGGCLEAVETQPDQWRVLAGSPEVLKALKPLLSI